MFEIKQLPDLLPEIKQAAEEKKLAIFIGAGMSRFMGCSSWSKLATNLLDKCEKEGLINNFEREVLSQSKDFKKTITICNHLLKNDDRFMDEMKKSLNDENVGNSDIDLQVYRDLFSLNGLFVTTNADRHIDQLFDTSNILFSKFGNKTKLENSKLYKIHGSITNTESLIFTVDSYIQRYTDSEFGLFLDRLFSSYTVLFVGYGLGEFELLDYLFKSIGKTETKHFFLKDYFIHEQRIYEFEQMYFKRLGIALIPYAKDIKGFNQLPEIIKNWVATLKSESLVPLKNYDDIDDALENPDE